MIVVTDVKIAKHAYDEIQAYQYSPRNLVAELWTGELPTMTQYDIETVKGQKFVNARGEAVVIGMSKAVQDAIGLPMEAFNKQGKEIHFLRDEIEYLKNENKRTSSMLDCYCSQTRWDLIKRIFTRRHR
jgi:hypothetical protein